jgi:hypothetical protein
VADGTSYWLLPATGTVGSTGAVRLLPGFDEFVLGYTDRTVSATRDELTRVVPGDNGMFLPAIVDASGRLLGLWRKQQSKGTTTVSFELFPGAEVDAREFDLATARYGRFIGIPQDSPA